MNDREPDLYKERSTMEIRKSTTEDLDRIMNIYDRGRKFMRENGNMNQWINGYPERELILNDIRKGNSYVCCDGEKITAVFYFGIEEEPTYRTIYQGKWLNKDRYGVIHRIAVDSNTKGTASFCIEWCYAQTGNLKIDTHRDNTVMQKVLEKNGFTYCGIIYIDDGSERIAFQKTAGRGNNLP